MIYQIQINLIEKHLYVIKTTELINVIAMMMMLLLLMMITGLEITKHSPLTAKFFCVDWQVLWVLLYHANTHSDIFEHYIKFDQHIQMCLFVEKYIT